MFPSERIPVELVLPRLLNRRPKTLWRKLLRWSNERTSGAVVAFPDHFAVPLDKSQTGRGLRMVSRSVNELGLFPFAGGAQAFCRIRGYLSPLRKKGLHVLPVLELAL
jgi:transposase